MSGKMPFEGTKQPFLRVLGKFLVSEFSVKNKSDIAKHKKKPRKPTFSGLFWREQDLSRGEASGERSNTVAKRCVAKRYVISLSCSRSIEKGLPLQAFVWRREQDLSRGEASGERSNTVAKRCVAKRYVISLSCSRSIEKGLPLQAFAWRREQDLNLRRLLTSHAFQFPNFAYFLHKNMLFYLFLHYFSQIF